MSKRHVDTLMLVAAVILTASSGCRRDPVERDLEENIIPMARALGVERRAELALTKWQNRTVDSEPILIAAVLGQPMGVEQIFLTIVAVDEDKDIIGFGIREELVDANGVKRQRLEEYPVFIHRRQPAINMVTRVSRVPIEVRDADQRLDADLWRKYVERKGINADRLLSVDYWRRTLPPVWLSIPEPNDLDVYVYAYDQAGHKSGSVALVNRMLHRDSHESGATTEGR